MDIFPVWLFFYKLFHTLDIFLLWIIIHVQSVHSLGGSALFLMVLFFLNNSSVFRGGFKVVVGFFQSFLGYIACLSRTISSGVSDLVARSLTVWPLFWWRFSQDLDHRKVPNFFEVLQSFQKDCSATASDVPGSLLLNLYFSCLVTQKLLMFSVSSIRWDF